MPVAGDGERTESRKTARGNRCRSRGMSVPAHNHSRARRPKRPAGYLPCEPSAYHSAQSSTDSTLALIRDSGVITAWQRSEKSSFARSARSRRLVLSADQTIRCNSPMHLRGWHEQLRARWAEKATSVRWYHNIQTSVTVTASKGHLHHSRPCHRLLGFRNATTPLTDHRELGERKWVVRF